MGGIGSKLLSVVVKGEVKCDEISSDSSDIYQATEAFEEQQSPIFCLNVDCLHKLMDYLTLQDLHSVGETCKAMQQIAGDYFQANYKSYTHVTSEGIEHGFHRTKINGFNKFVTNLIFSPVPIHETNRSIEEQTFYAAKYCNRKLKQIRFYYANLTATDLWNLRDSLKHVESVILEYCTATQEFYRQFPKLCLNLKRLYIRDYNCRFGTPQNTGFDWLLWTFPKLEHLHWSLSRCGATVNELKTFFRNNSHVKSFTTDLVSLYANKHLLIESEIKLNDLTVDVSKHFRPPQHVEQIYFDALDELAQHGIFKRLHYNLMDFDQEVIDRMTQLPSIKSLCLDTHINDESIINLPNLIDVVELKIGYCSKLNTNLVAKQLENLQRIHFQHISLQDVRAFFRQSINLRKMKIDRLEDSERSFDDEMFGNVLYLSLWNEEREKLPAAKKVTIYIYDEVYLATKWAMKGKEFRLVEMQRGNSHEWGHHFIPWH